jgi:PIN domain nuclease of toxin-antitoxin system
MGQRATPRTEPIPTMLLLDSQALLWLLDDNPRLGPYARQAITSAQGVHVSAASVWELTIKTMLGKLSVPADLSTRLTAQGLTLISVTAEHAEALRDFPELTRHDPFDRLLVAQASVTGLQLLTADQVLLGLGRDFIVDASR